MPVMLSIDGYHIRRSLGVGATSEVFEAIRALDQKPVALKVFSPIVTADETVVERLQNEVDVLLKLQHPNVVSLQSSVKSEKQFCLDLELVVGQDLRQWTQNYTLPLIEPCLWVLAQIARGLGAAHEIGVIHRDLKPENVLISNAGDVKITDFGLARQINRLTITRMGLLIGSLGYIAPEVIDGDRVSEQSDIFSFGVIAYELLTKRAPFGAETPQGIIKSVMDGAFTPIAAVNSAVPPQIAELIERCLARKPELRPQSIWQVEAALMTYLGSSGIRALCKDLVATQKRDGTAANALVLKHEMLWKTINTAKSQAAIVPLVLETMSLFPDDTKATELLRTLSESTHHRRRKKQAFWSLMALLLLGSVGIYQLLIGTEESQAPEVQASSQNSPPMIDTIMSEKTRPLEPPSNSVNTKIAALEKSSAATALPEASMRERKPAPAAERQTHGFLSFILPEGVNVEVDGLLVPASSILRYQVSTGTHSVRMVKEGFLPIESKVSVRAGQTATINALGAPPKNRTTEEDENE